MPEIDHEDELIRKLRQADSHVLQSEKMASIGQLAAGVAHELNNPIAFISSNMGALKDYVSDLLEIIDATEKLESVATWSEHEVARIRSLKEAKDYAFLRRDVAQLLDESVEGLARVKGIVNDLKDFSYVGEGEWLVADLHRGLDTTLNIVWHELKYKCQVIKQYGRLPPVRCLASQLNQVFMNLLINAGQAITDHGTITIATKVEKAHVWISISDTGCGIPADRLSRIFDPFYTTKPIGKGTGLGLALAYSIVKRHDGRMLVDSVVGKGTTFTVQIPVEPMGSGAQAQQTLSNHTLQ